MSCLINPFIFFQQAEVPPSYVDSTKATVDVANSSITIPNPLGSVGDMMVAYISQRNVASISAPAGWTLVDTLTYTTAQRDSIYIKTKESGDTSDWTFSWSGAAKAAAVIYCATGVDDYDFTHKQTASTTTHTADQLINIPSDYVLIQHLTNSNTTFTEDAAMTEREFALSSAGDTSAVFVADEYSASSGDTGTRTITSAVSLTWAFTGLFALFKHPIDAFATTSSIILGTVDPATETNHDALSHAIRAEARLRKIDGGDLTFLNSLVSNLWDNRYNNGTIDGFGLNATFDSFGDGSTNPADAIYSVTTAWCGLAFLDAYLVTGDANHLSYANTCATSLASSDLWNSSGGWAWWSDQAADKVDPDYEVYNVSAQACLLFSRLGVESSKVSAQKTRIEGVQGVGVPAGLFPYSATSSSYDLHHDAYVVEFLIDQNSTAADTWISNHTANYYTGFDLEAAYRPSKGCGYGIYILGQHLPSQADMIGRAQEFVRQIDSSGFRTGYVENIRESSALAFGLATASAVNASIESFFH